MSGTPATIRWDGDAATGCIAIIDQTLLPETVEVLELRDVDAVWEAIKMLRVRGAPAIGVAAGMGVALGVRDRAPASVAEATEALNSVADHLATSRPTAVNLFWALDRMRDTGRRLAATEGMDVPGFLQALQEESVAIRDEDAATCRSIGRHGATLVPAEAGILTHCNAGGLATAEYGTALGVIRAAAEAGKKLRVFADETRPLLQGSRLTAFELAADGIDTTVLCDNMAAHAMKLGMIDLVVVGADRIAANGDAANKIGTYSVALAAAAHDIPFYVAAPLSTFDLSLDSGDGIPIEERMAEEVTNGFGKRTAPEGIKVFNPAFDVTPAHLIRALITEHGVIERPTTEAIAAHFAAAGAAAG